MKAFKRNCNMMKRIWRLNVWTHTVFRRQTQNRDRKPYCKRLFACAARSVRISAQDVAPASRTPSKTLTETARAPDLSHEIKCGVATGFSSCRQSVQVFSKGLALAVCFVKSIDCRDHVSSSVCHQALPNRSTGCLQDLHEAWC
ncbi:hypothetical protein Ddc_23572 [Ditylenchus destructor]|nr:hypothetical protein Ddc_23572 [Ditylenchus destructor]